MIYYARYLRRECIISGGVFNSWQSSVKRISHRQSREKGGRSRDADCAYTQRIWMIFTLNDISAHHTQRVITSCKEAACRVATALEQSIFTLPPLRSMARLF